MSNSLKISLIVLLVLAIISAIVVPIVLKWNSIKAAFTGAQTYTYEDVQNSYDKGYSDGAGDLENSSKLLEEFKNTLDENTTKFEKELNEKTTQIEEAQKELQMLTEINAELSNKDKENTELIEQLQAKIAELEETIKTLNSEKSRLSELLKAYEGREEEYNVYFYDGDLCHNVKLVKSGEASTLPADPSTKEGSRMRSKFIGWSLDKKNVVDVNTVAIHEETTFYAVYREEYYSINEYSKESGRELYSIATKEDLKKLAIIVAGGDNVAGIEFILTEDINLLNFDMPCIGCHVFYGRVFGSRDFPFSGIFNGNNHTIYNYKIRITEGIDYGPGVLLNFDGSYGTIASLSLFGLCKDAIIKDLTFEFSTYDCSEYQHYNATPFIYEFTVSDEATYGLFNCHVHGMMLNASFHDAFAGFYFYSDTVANYNILHDCDYDGRIVKQDGFDAPLDAYGSLIVSEAFKGEN